MSSPTTPRTRTTLLLVIALVSISLTLHIAHSLPVGQERVEAAAAAAGAGAAKEGDREEAVGDAGKEGQQPDDPLHLENLKILSPETIKWLNDMFAKNSFLHGFAASLAVIIVSELGDKTFFIAAILAMKHRRSTVLVGALGALAVMTVLAALLGHVLSFIPRGVTYYTSSVLLVLFGLKMVHEAHGMSSAEAQEEFEEVQAELKKSSEDRPPKPTNSFQSIAMIFSPVLLQAFTLTFLAEWGDRSQIATVLLAAREDTLAVIIGGTLGHAFCTGLAVLGGRIVAQSISVKAVTYVGAFVFLAFGLSAFVIGP